MATNGRDLPILVVGGGIGGLVTAYALAHKGFPVRVLEQAPEFKELGAGIQLGPNIFRALETIGLKDAVLADAWVPNGMEMRNALTGNRVTRIELGPAARDRFKQPYAVTHRADIHGAYLRACEGNNLVSLENNQRVDAIRDNGGTVTAILASGEEAEALAVIGCDGLWSKVRETIVGDGPPRVSGHIAYRAVLKREDVPEGTCGVRTSSCGPGRARISSTIPCAAASSTTSSPCSIPTITRRAGTWRAILRS